MLILAIETATTICSIAILKDGNVLTEWYVQSGRTHSTGIMQQLEGVLKRLNFDKKDVDAVAVDIGPGSFTGLRIGLALGKSLSIGLGIPIVGVSSDAVLARAVTVTKGYVAVLIDAQQHNFYYTLYKCNDGVVEKIKETEVLDGDNIKVQLCNLDEQVILVGDYDEKIFEGINKLQVLPQHLRLPRGYNLALVASELLQDGLVQSPYNIGLEYLKLSEAERVWLNKK